MIEKVQIFAAHGDGGERSTGPIIGYFSTEELATAAAHQMGYYGSDGFVSNHLAFKDGDDYWVIASFQPSKLTA